MATAVFSFLSLPGFDYNICREDINHVYLIRGKCQALISPDIDC
ncbi:Uncharacterised protein [Tatumella ptyseos]|uniref:Uncharacterized protein n=1 Tax=Tatumella ptyseos TaxID=82987 RepID=A0A2X5SIW0_9GAMM|nr:Uncharacterised protein [Tatumella ptyseos]